MNHSSLLTLILILGPAMTSASTAWERYLEDPTPEAAAGVDRVAYSDSDPYHHYSFDLQVLQDRVEAGDSASLDLAFRALRNSDGATAQALTQVIGSGIVPDPEAFLSALVRSGVMVDAKGLLPSILGNLGAGYVDRPAAQIVEVTERIDRLESVTTPELQATRDSCLSELQCQLKSLIEWKSGK